MSKAASSAKPTDLWIRLCLAVGGVSALAVYAWASVHVSDGDSIADAMKRDRAALIGIAGIILAPYVMVRAMETFLAPDAWLEAFQRAVIRWVNPFLVIVAAAFAFVFGLVLAHDEFGWPALALAGVGLVGIVVATVAEHH